MKAQDERIDEQDKIIRLQNRRIVALEDYLEEVKKTLAESDIHVGDVPHAPELPSLPPLDTEP